MQSLIDEGRITEEESRMHPHRNLILRAVDGVHETDPDLFYIELAPGDRLLLCSDGCLGRARPRAARGHPRQRLGRLRGGGADPGLAGGRQLRQRHLRRRRRGGPRGAARRGRPAGRHRGRSRSSWARRPTRPAVPARSQELLPRPPRRRHRRARPGPRRGRRPARRPRGAPLRPPGAAAPSAGCAGSWSCSCSRPSWPRVLGALAYRWSQDQYYVAATARTVAICKGVQADIPGMRL